MKYKHTILMVGLIMLTGTLSAQIKPDLEKISYRKAFAKEFKDKELYPVEREQWTGLPGFTTENLKPFRFGTAEFSNGGEYGHDDVPYSKLSFVFGDLKRTDLVGIVLRIQISTESKKLKKYIVAKYGKGKLIIAPPKPRSTGEVYGYGVNSYDLLKTKQTLIIVDNFTDKNGKSAYGIDVYIIDNQVKSPYQGAQGTILRKLLVTMGENTSIKQY